MTLAQEPASSFRPRPLNDLGASDAAFTPSPKSISPPKLSTLTEAPSPSQPASSVKPVQATQPGLTKIDPTDPNRFLLRLEPPGPDRLFGARETEAQFELRMKQLFAENFRSESAKLPEKPILSKEEYKPRNFAPMTMRVEPAYIVHRRLFFEEKNAERYGWELGFLQPFVSTAAFYQDVIFFPKHLLTQCRYWETNAGLCLPGDPVPFLWYPPEFFGNWCSIQIGIGIGTPDWETTALPMAPAPATEVWNLPPPSSR